MNMYVKLLLKCYIILTIFYGGASKEVGDSCEPNKDVVDGVCAVITDCEVAVRAIKKNNYHTFARCGFEGDNEVVCCPKTTSRFGGSTETPSVRPLSRADIECQKITENSIPPLDLHIIGGESASPGEFPHMVALGFERDDGYEFDCGGSLVSDRYVLTAAHCVETLDKIVPSIVRMGVVELGSKQWNEESDVRIADIIKHPGYTKRKKYDDLALIRLSRPVQFNSYQNAACLYTSEEDPRTELAITGWGTTSGIKNIRSNILLKANVSVVTRSRCNESYTNWRKLPDGITETQLCAGDPEGRRDTCQGDSGGPLQALLADGQYRLVGVTSFGRSCAGAAPGVYTRLAHYVPWIESVVWRN